MSEVTQTEATEPSASADESGRRTRLSLVVPAYNEQESVDEILGFYRDVRRIHDEFEIELVVVDDGSDDGTSEALLSALQDDDRAQVVTLSRNFGSHAAVTAGLVHCTGDIALTLSADQQEPLSAIAQFIDAWREGGEIVWGLRSVRATRKGIAEYFATSFSRVFNKHSEVPTYPQEGPSQILVTRQVIDVLASMPEINRNVLAMVAWLGFDQRKVFFEQQPRPHGVSKWTRKKKVKLVLDSFIEFSSAPIRLLAYAGIVFGSIGALALVTALVLVFFDGAPAGTALVSGLVLAVGGVNLVALGLVGEYMWRAGDDARRRPVFIVSKHTTHGTSTER